jgi:hypothetical protein
VKERVKGSWAEEWILTPAQQREVLESRDEREEERRKRMLYRVSPFPSSVTPYHAVNERRKEQADKIEKSSQSTRSQRLISTRFCMSPPHLLSDTDNQTKTRVIPTLPYPHGGLGVKTEGAPSMMLRALIERNTQSQSQPQSQSQSV